MSGDIPYFPWHLYDVYREVAFIYYNDVLPLVQDQHVSYSGHIPHLSSQFLYPRDLYVEDSFLCVMSTLLAVSVTFQCFARHCFGMSAFLYYSIPVHVHFCLMDTELLQFPPLSIPHSRVTVGKLFVHAVVRYFCCRLYLCYKFCPLDL